MTLNLTDVHVVTCVANHNTVCTGSSLTLIADIAKKERNGTMKFLELCGHISHARCVL